MKHIHAPQRTNVVKVTLVLVAASVSLCVCLPDFSKSADRFPRNFSWSIGVIGRRERIKTFRKFRPLMCRNWKNGEKWPILRKFSRATSAGLRNALRSEFARTPARWPKVRLQHGPIARWPGAWPVAFDGGPCQTLLCSESTLVVRLPGRPLAG